MRVLVDTNIVLDLLLDREPFATPAAKLAAAIETGLLTGYLCATSVTTIDYLLAKNLGAAKATRAVSSLLSLFEIASVNRVVLENALQAGFSDFEDAVIHEAACHTGADALVTRNLKDFLSATLPVYTAADLLALLQAKQ